MLSGCLSRSARCSRGTSQRRASRGGAGCHASLATMGLWAGPCVRESVCVSAWVSFLSPSLSPFIRLHKT